MRRIGEVTGQDLKWSQPRALSMEYALHAGAELAATLKFRSSFGTLATAESADGCWRFKRVGFWQARATIRTCDSEENLAIFTNSTWASGGTLEFPGGARFNATTNIWTTDLGFRTVADEPLVRFHYGGVLRKSADVEIAPLALGMPELPLLVMFGWYLAIMLDMDASAAESPARRT